MDCFDSEDTGLEWNKAPCKENDTGAGPKNSPMSRKESIHIVDAESLSKRDGLS
jgi:hypothetical protein